MLPEKKRIGETARFGRKQPWGGEPRPVGQVLSELFARRGWAQQSAHAAWEELWTAVADPDLAAHSRVVGLRGGRLEIVVDSSVLLQELTTFRRAELLKALQDRFPEPRLRDLRVRVGPVH